LLEPRAAYKPLCGHPCYRLYIVIQIWISANVKFLKTESFKLQTWDADCNILSTTSRAKLSVVLVTLRMGYTGVELLELWRINK
jgi:hypothetical protein